MSDITKQEFEALVKNNLHRAEKPVLMAKFVGNLPYKKKDKEKIAAFYGAEAWTQNIILKLPFVGSCGDNQHKKIWYKPILVMQGNPQYESVEAFEAYFEKKAREFLKATEHLLDAFAEKIFRGEDRQRIAELYGVDFGKGVEILRRMPFFEISVGENSAETIRIKRAEPENLEEPEIATQAVKLPPREKVKKLLELLNAGLWEKETEMKLALLASVAGESVFFIGLPGTAKSMVSSRLKEIFSKPTYFEYLMNKFSTPDEIFGPVSLKSLENDEYKRVVKNFLPDADVAFLDEIWKANSMILNTLLTILNEKKFHNGNSVIKVPLKVLIAASNELPMKDSGLEALWDRFLFRVAVKRICDRSNFFEMLESTDATDISLPEELKISETELEEWQEGIKNIWIPEAVENVIWAVKSEMEVRNGAMADGEEKFDVSDRRWKKILKMLRTSAFLNGRSEIDLMDCQLISYCIWGSENQRVQASEIVEKCVGQNGFQVATAIGDLEEAKEKFEREVDEAFFKEDENDRKTLVPEDAVFENKRLYGIAKAYFDEEYKQIKERIEKKINELEANCATEEEAFSSNLFADQSMKAVFMKEVEAAKNELRKLSNRLEKVRGKYANC